MSFLGGISGSVSLTRYARGIGMSRGVDMHRSGYVHGVGMSRRGWVCLGLGISRGWVPTQHSLPTILPSHSLLGRFKTHLIFGPCVDTDTDASYKSSKNQREYLRCCQCWLLVCDALEFSLNVFTELSEFSDTKCYILKRLFELTTSCVIDQDATTVPARNKYQRGSLNWAQFKLQWFPEFV